MDAGERQRPKPRGVTVYVTGGGNGIGRGIVRRLAAAGYRVAVLDIDARAAAQVATELTAGGAECVGIGLDVSDEASVAAAFDAAKAAAGEPDALVNNAGIWVGGAVTEIAVSDWDRTMAVNTRGTFLCCRAALPAMVRRGRGAIVNVASIAGLKGTRRAGAYNPSKAAVIALTKNIALDYAPYGIRANAICPGLIGGTRMERTLRDFRGDTPEYQQAVLDLHPLGRLGTPGDLAEATLFLLSEQASWVSGTAMVVDGACMAGY